MNNTRYISICSCLEKLPIRKYLVLVLVCLLNYQLAIFTWHVLGKNNFFNKQMSSVIMGSKKTQGSEPESIQVSTVISNTVYSFFGRTTLGPVTGNTAPITVTSQLKARVTGIIFSSVPANSIAIIEYNGRQASYVINDTIDTTDAVITDISNNKVLLLYQGKQEMLSFDDETESSASQSVSVTPSLRYQVLKEPANLLDFVAITPVKENDQLQGYRLNPGPKPDLFKRSGLQANDLAIAINGFDLRNRKTADKLMATLNENTQLSITVLRNGVEDIIFIDFAG